MYIFQYIKARSALLIEQRYSTISTDFTLMKLFKYSSLPVLGFHQESNP